MAVEIDENGFFRQDFSAASDWEIFTAQLGDIFQKLSISDIDSDDYAVDVFGCDWNVQTETILLFKEKISVSSYNAKKLDAKENCRSIRSDNPVYNDLMRVENTFSPPLTSKKSGSVPTISCLYGLHRFLLIHFPSERQFVSNPSEFYFLLSAAAIVAAEYCPMTPIFVQIHDTKIKFFHGIGMHIMQRTNFDVVTLKKSPFECRYLSGLLTIFKEKLPANCMHPITVSVRKTYAPTPVRKRFPMSLPFHKSISENDTFLNTNEFFALPCGYFPDAFTEIYLIYDWLEVSENSALDSPLYSDFVPSKSSNCIMQLAADAASYLSNCLRDFVKLYSDKENLETDSHFRRLTDDSHFLKDSKKSEGPLHESELRDFLAYLFPDLYPDSAKYSYPNEQTEIKEFQVHRIKSATMDSLSCRLSCLLASCNAHYGGKSGLAQLWAAFTTDLRFIWDTRLSIPGVAAGFPDTRTCLLNQKLQMLNYCIERSKLRKYGNISESNIDFYTNFDENKQNVSSFEKVSNETDEGEDEFYDCTDFLPEGRDKCLGDIKLLDCDEPLYIPVTQDPVPKTEDESEADAEAILKFGTNSDLSMEMCSSLLSDMEAFKAANPKGKMEDFIRWYSPKDWEEDEFGVGRLSARMQTPGNTWQMVWQQAQRVPVSKQKRLFDETTEAMKVLAFLETRNISEIYQLTVMTLLHAAIIKFKDILETAKVIDIFEAEIEALLGGLCHLSWDVKAFGQHGSKVEHLIERLEELETQFYQYKCLEQILDYPDNISLTEVKQIFREMIKNESSCKISSSNIFEKYVGGNQITGMTKRNLDVELDKKLISKEYVLRVRGEKPFGPQFLRAIIKCEELCLCGAFTENTALI